MEEAKVVIAVLALLASIVAIVISARTAWKLKDQDIAIDRRKLFISALWDKLIEVRSINPTNATFELVHQVVSTLYLVALCWKENIVDRALVAHAFGDSYIQRVREVEGITRGVHKQYDEVIASLGIDGPTLLSHYNLIRPVRDDIQSTLNRKQLQP